MTLIRTRKSARRKLQKQLSHFNQTLEDIPEDEPPITIEFYTEMSPKDELHPSSTSTSRYSKILRSIHPDLYHNETKDEEESWFLPQAISSSRSIKHKNINIFHRFNEDAKVDHKTIHHENTPPSIKEYLDGLAKPYYESQEDSYDDLLLFKSYDDDDESSNGSEEIDMSKLGTKRLQWTDFTEDAASMLNLSWARKDLNCSSCTDDYLVPESEHETSYQSTDDDDASEFSSASLFFQNVDDWIGMADIALDLLLCK